MTMVLTIRNGSMTYWRYGSVNKVIAQDTKLDALLTVTTHSDHCDHYILLTVTTHSDHCDHYILLTVTTHSDLCDHYILLTVTTHSDHCDHYILFDCYNS